MRATVARGLTSGATMAAATATTMMIASSLARGSPWAGLNVMATTIGVGGRRAPVRFDPQATPAGLAVLIGGLLAWGLLYEGALAATHRQRSPATAALSGALGYVVDKVALPSRVVPNFRRTMGLGGTIAKYAALAIASAVSARIGPARVTKSTWKEAREALSSLREAEPEPPRPIPGGFVVSVSSDDDVVATPRPPADS